MKHIAKTVFLKAIEAVDPSKRLKETVQIEKDRLLIRVDENLEKVFNVGRFRRIFLIGTGKASTSMAQAIEEIFGDRITKVKIWSSSSFQVVVQPFFHFQRMGSHSKKNRRSLNFFLIAERISKKSTRSENIYHR